jgi:hypothetical protein
MNIKRVKVLSCDKHSNPDGFEQDGYLFVEKHRTLFLTPSDNKGRWASTGCYDANDWENYINPLLKKEILFDPWSYLKDIDIADSELTSPLIHKESNLVITADDDDEVRFVIQDSALQCLYEVAHIHVEQGITWDQMLLDAIFSTKLGKDCPDYCRECKDIHSLLSYFRSLYLDNPEAIELMEINLIKEKRIKYANG